MLNERLANLLSLLSQDDYQTSQYLAQRLNLSSKTVRNLIKQLNNDLLGNGANIITKHGYGFKLQVYNLEEFNRFLTAEHSNIPNSPEERIQYLLEYFLNNEKYVKEEDISDLLHVCKKTLTADLKKVEQILNRYGLSVKRKPYYGMKVVGDEFHIRLCIAECIENKKIRNLLIVDNDVKREISLIADCITECLDNETYMISDIALQNLIIHIYISVKRIQEGHYVPLLYAEDDNYIGGEEYKLAKKCTNKIEENFHIQFPEQEVAYIAIHLAGKKIAKARKDGNGNTVISSGISELVTAMLEEVYQVFHIDFRNDLELIMSLGQHLVPLIVRIKYGMRMKNPLLDEIKKNYCLAYVMASQASVVIKQRLYKELDDDEIGYIALAFALALERHRTQIKGKNILLVCYSGIGSSKLLAFRLKEIFGNYINEIYTCSLNTIGKVNYSKFDYIFTTVPINEPVPLPVCEISFPIQTQKFDTMIQFLKPKEECKITQYYPEDLFFSGVDLDDVPKSVEIGMAATAIV